jgi:uncharacterized membrane protein
MKIRGALIASAALGLLAVGPAMAEHHEQEESKVKCYGVNACAGKGECGAPDGSHDCGGKNSCKGKGWVYKASADACSEEGGKVIE